MFDFNIIDIQVWSLYLILGAGSAYLGYRNARKKRVIK